MRLGGEVATVYILLDPTHFLLRDGDIPSAPPSPVGCALLYDTVRLTGPLPIRFRNSGCPRACKSDDMPRAEVFCPRSPMTEDAV